MMQFILGTVLATWSCAVDFTADLTAKDYLSLGAASAAEGDLDKAITEYTEAIRLDPNFALAYVHRGEAWQSKRDWEYAAKDYGDAIRIDPKLHIALNNLAWLQATCPDERYRDGQQAVANAKQASDLTEWKNGDCFDTLAAACAEAGQFAEAIKYQEKTIALATRKASKQQTRGRLERLELYKAGKPYRDLPKE